MKTRIPYFLLAFSVLAACDDSEDCPGDLTGSVSSISGEVSFCGNVSLGSNFSIADNTTLTILPGTSVSFGEGEGIDTEGVEGFKLLAEGTTAAPITFKAKKGKWSGIHLSDGSSSVFSQVIFDGVLTDEAAIEGDGMVLADITIRNSGLGVKTAAFGAGSRNLNMTESKGPIAYLTAPAALRDFPGGETSADDNSVVVDFSELDNIEDDFEFKTPAEYHVLEWTQTAGNLHVSPGVTIRSESSIRAKDLYLRGTEEAPITLLGKQAYLATSDYYENTEVVFQWVNVDGWSVDFDAPTLIQHAEFSNCARSCFANSSSFNDESTDVKIVSLDQDWIGPQFLMEVTPDGLFNRPENLSLPQDSVERIRISYGPASQTGNIPDLGFSYYLDKGLNNEPGVDISIASGVTMEFGPESYILLEDGKFEADGVTFIADKQSWYGMNFKSMKPGSYIRNSSILDASDPTIFTDGSIELTDNVLSGEQYCVNTIESDTTDYAANNEMSCADGDVDNTRTN